MSGILVGLPLEVRWFGGVVRVPPLVCLSVCDSCLCLSICLQLLLFILTVVVGAGCCCCCSLVLFSFHYFMLVFFVFLFIFGLVLCFVPIPQTQFRFLIEFPTHTPAVIRCAFLPLDIYYSSQFAFHFYRKRTNTYIPSYITRDSSKFNIWKSKTNWTISQTFSIPHRN